MTAGGGTTEAVSEHPQEAIPESILFEEHHLFNTVLKRKGAG